MSETNNESKRGSSFLDAPPKFTFAFGLVLGIAIFALIGFFTLLSRGEGVGLAKSDSSNSNTAKAAAVGNTNPDAPNLKVDTLPPDSGDNPKIDAGSIKITDKDHIRGEGKITLVEFADFQCPFCQRIAPTMDKILQDYNGKVRQVFKHYPLSFHPNARPAALASECAAEQGKFWEMHDELFANQSSLSADFYKQTAQKLGLDTGKFDKCVEENRYSQRIADDESLGNSIGVQGTPATVLIDDQGNAQMISGAVPYEQFKSAIDAAL